MNYKIRSTKLSEANSRFVKIRAIRGKKVSEANQEKFVQFVAKKLSEANQEKFVHSWQKS